MKRFLLVFIAFLLLDKSSAQDNLFSTESFIIKLSGANLLVENLERNIVFEKIFSHPKGFVVDMDNDGAVEFLVNDFTIRQGKSFYSTFLYNTVDTFYLIDSIYSGLKEPYYSFSDELNEVILITGSPDFDSLNTSEMETIYSPLVCWGFVGFELAIVNDQLYDFFIAENEKYIDFIDQFYKSKGTGCNSTSLLKSVIAALFVNYIYADEKAVAEKSIQQYYNCDDREKFKEAIKKLL
ncbi:MAG: hypothetical protein NTX22_02080 [Ignavibacteriales bacterium]|nr:hypothetical protein [Ignavibacteriales bacterium]